MTDYSIICGGKETKNNPITIKAPTELIKIAKKSKKASTVSYGEYPSTIVSETLSKELTNLLEESKLKPTGKKYTTDYKEKVSEYEYKNKKYVLVTANNTYYEPEYKDEYETYEYWDHRGQQFIDRPTGKKYDANEERRTLKDYTVLKYGKKYWVEVEPVKWKVDIEKGTAEAQDIHLPIYIANNSFEQEIVPLKKEQDKDLTAEKIKKLQEIKEDIRTLQREAATLTNEIAETTKLEERKRH